MKKLLYLAWFAIAVADVALGYFIVWDYARTYDLAVFVMALGALNAYWAFTGLRRPKRIVKFNHIQGAVWQ